ERPGRLPFESLAVVPDRIEVPRQHAKEMQLHMSVRIDEAAHEPRHGVAHHEAQLLAQFTIERGARRFARLELAAGEFPVSFVGLPPRGMQASLEAARREALTSRRFGASMPPPPRSSWRTARRCGRCASRAAARTAARRECAPRARVPSAPQ